MSPARPIQVAFDGPAWFSGGVCARHAVDVYRHQNRLKLRRIQLPGFGILENRLQLLNRNGRTSLVEHAVAVCADGRKVRAWLDFMIGTSVCQLYEVVNLDELTPD